MVMIDHMEVLLEVLSHPCVWRHLPLLSSRENAVSHCRIVDQKAGTTSRSWRSNCNGEGTSCQVCERSGEGFEVVVLSEGRMIDMLLRQDEPGLVHLHIDELLLHVVQL